MIRRWFAIVTLLVVSAVFLLAAETPIPPSPTRFVTDNAGFLSPQVAADLNGRLAAYQQQTGHQVLVYIGQTTGDAPLDDWAVRAFKAWKIGRQGMDDGLALFIMAQDRKLRIEVGYGLEGDLPDAVAGRIINEVMVPRIQGGDRDGAVSAGLDAVASAIGGQALPASQLQQQQRRTGRSGQSRPMTLGQMILYGVIGIVILIVLITNPSLAVYLLMSMLSGGGGGRRSGGDGWGGGGGGGFSGGGGRSGGGGASGSW